MDNLAVYFISLIILIAIVLSALDISRSVFLTKRQKANWMFLVFIIPFGGSIVYYIYVGLRSRKNFGK
jgi:hypothetical protein